MPTVPTLTGPQVESRPLAPRFQDASGATAQNFGVGLGAGMDQAGRRISQAGDQLGRLALQIQIDDNERDAKRLDVELSSTLRNINYGDGTAQNPGYFGKRGENAINSFGDTQKQIQDAHQKLLQSAKNDRVRQMYGDVANKRIEQEFNTMSRFVGQERRAAADTLSEARMQEAAANASVAWNNPEVLRQSLGIALGEAKSMAERNGWSPEVLAAKEREAKTVIASSAIKAALAVEATGKASSLFKQFQGDMTAEVRNSLQKQIREGSVAGSAMALAKQADAMFRGDIVKQIEWLRAQKIDPRAASQAFGQITAFHNIIKQGEQEQLRGTAQAQFDNITATFSDEKDRLAAARKLPPELRDAVEARLNGETSRERQRQNDEDRTLDRAEREIRNNEAARQRVEREENEKAYKQADDLLRDGVKVNSLSPELRGKLKPEQLHNLEVRENQLARGEKFAPESNDDFLRTVLTMSPGDLANLSQAELRSKLSEPDFNRVEKLRQDTIAGRRDPSNPLSPINRTRKQITEVLGPLDSKSKKQMAARAELMVDEQIRVEQGEGKKAISAQREDEIINSVFDKIVLSGGRYLGFGDKETETFRVDVPKEFKETFARETRAKKGRNPTDLEITTEYVKKFNEKKAK